MEFGSQEFFERLKAGVAAGDPDVYVDLNNTVEHAVRNLVRSKVKFSDVDDVIQEIQLFDIYTGKPIPEDKKSVAFALKLRHEDHTLTDAEADSDVKAVLALLQEELGAVLR